MHCTWRCRLLHADPKKRNNATTPTNTSPSLTQFDVTFPRMPCAWLSLDAMDVSGELHLDVDHAVFKQRLSGADGAPVSEAERHVVERSAHVPLAAAGNATGGGGANATAAGAAAHPTSGATGAVPRSSSAESPAAPSAASSSPSSSPSASSCGTCYGAEDADHPCCNSCDDVRAAYQRRGWAMLALADVSQCAHDGYLEAVRRQAGEGCRVWGRLEVNKVAGNFHFAAGRSYQQGSVHVHDMAPFAGRPLDFSHSIKHLSFGPQYPGMVNPLDGATSADFGPAAAAAAKAAGGRGGASRLAGVSAQQQQQQQQQQQPGSSGSTGSSTGAAASPASPAAGGMFQYFLKVVPTVYVDSKGRATSSNQYSVTEHFREAGSAASSPAAAAASSRTLPGLFVFYDLSPIKVHIAEARASLLHYLTNLCAIVGGVFAVSGLLDGAVHTGERIIRRKMQMGKYS